MLQVLSKKDNVHILDSLPHLQGIQPYRGNSMQHSSVVQILKVNDPRSGIGKNNKPWQMQEAECILLDGDGAVSQVGVLDVPKEMIGTIVPGTYTVTFSLAAHYQTRKIESRLTNLTRLPAKQERSAAPADKA
jgi:hypothetical protein